jgi:hypothetical protein
VIISLPTLTDFDFVLFDIFTNQTAMKASRIYQPKSTEGLKDLSGLDLAAICMLSTPPKSKLYSSKEKWVSR